VDVPQHLCRCGSPLLARYDLLAAAKTFTRENLAAREASLWRYTELLPLRDANKRVCFGETFTPLLPVRALGAELGLDGLFIKDEGLLPTASFKARGAAVGVSRARELGVTNFAMPTNGNAGGAWAAYGSRAGIEAYIVMPQSAPAINRLECAIAGAHVWLVDGLISDAGKIVGKAVSEYGLYDAATLKEPYRIEGKKTLGFELIEQFAEAEGRMKWAPNKKLHFEVAVIKAIQTLSQVTLTEVIENLAALRGGSFAVDAVPDGHASGLRGRREGYRVRRSDWRDSGRARG